MVVSSSRENHHNFFSILLRDPPHSSSPPTAAPLNPSTASLSPHACLLQKQHHMRLVVADMLPLPERPYASFAFADHTSQMLLQPGASVVRPTSFASELGFYPQTVEDEHCGENYHQQTAQRKRHGKRRKAFSLRVGNTSLKRLLSGAFAGAVSRTAVAPLETIRTHLMVGSGGYAVTDVFHHIMQTEGWLGLFRGNGVNVIRVAPSKAIELFAYDTIKKGLDRTPWVSSHLPIPTSSIAGATAGVCSTVCTYPLELLKTRLTIQRGAYKNLLDAFIQIYQKEGPRELYRGLTPSVIGVVPYAATNYFAYDFLKKLYKEVSHNEQVGNLPTLLIGSAAGAFACASTFPLEVARKQMQVGALTGRPAYRNLFHALSSLLEQHGPAGLYRGLGASCFKLIPAAGISFMCYEACKRVLIEDDTV